MATQAFAFDASESAPGSRASDRAAARAARAIRFIDVARLHNLHEAGKSDDEESTIAIADSIATPPCSPRQKRRIAAPRPIEP